MFGKLLKYDFMASTRKMLPLILGGFGLTLVLCLMNLIFGNQLYGINSSFNGSNGSTGGVIAIGILYGVLVLFVSVAAMLYVIFGIQHYAESVYGKQGYLLHTLPVSTVSILLSKLVAVLLWGLLSMVIACLAFGLLIGSMGVWPEFWSEAWPNFIQLIQENPSTTFQIILFFLSSAIFSWMHIFFACSLGSLPTFSNRGTKILMGIVFYFATSILFGMIGGNILVNAAKYLNYETATSIVNHGLLSSSILQLIGSVVMFVISAYLMKKHKSL